MKKVRTQEYTAHIEAKPRHMRRTDGCVRTGLAPRLSSGIWLPLAYEDGEALRPVQLEKFSSDKERALTVIGKVNCDM